MKIKYLAIGLLFFVSCSKSDLASRLSDEYALKRTFSSAYNELSLDSNYGAWVRLNAYQQGQKRVFYYFEKIDITFEVSGEGAINPDLVTNVWDGKK
jgi:hypothetical protein